MKFKIIKAVGPYPQLMTCQCCFKKHKAIYKVEGISRPRHINWISDFVCSLECADMYILARL